MENKKDESEKSKVKDKILQVKGFGDSYYIPLTKQFRAIGVEEHGLVNVSVRENKEIVITRHSEED